MKMLNVGDKVTIKNDIREYNRNIRENYISSLIVEDMYRYAGMQDEISSVESDFELGFVYHLSNTPYVWTSDCFEEFVEDDVADEDEINSLLLGG